MDSVNKLQSVLEQYAKQATCDIKVQVTTDGDMCTIRWDHVKGNWKTFHEKEFPVKDIDSRINNYKNKLNVK